MSPSGSDVALTFGSNINEPFDKSCRMLKGHTPYGLFRQRLNGNGNGNLINVMPILSHCNGNWNLHT